LAIRKPLHLLLAVVLTASIALAGCTGGGAATNTEAPAPDAEKPATAEQPAAEAPAEEKKGYDDIIDIDWYVNLSWWKYSGDWGNDMFSKYIQENFGLNINFITPAGDGADQISAMIATGSVPDLVTVESWLDYKTKLAQGGYLISLNELIEQHAPTWKPYEDIFGWYKEADGKTYASPNFAYSRHAMKPGEQLEPNSGFTLRSDIYEQLGRPDISTADKFLDALERVKNEVKTYDGKPLIPMQLYEFTQNGNQSVNWLTEYFAVPYEDASGKQLNRAFQPEYWDVLKFLNEAYRRGLISQDNFTDKRDQINEKVASGRVFASLTAPQDFTQQFRTLWEADNNAKYEGFALRNYKGDDPVLTDIRGFGWLVTLVGKESKAHDRIAKLLEFLNSKEGQHIAHFGWEGITYNYNADGTIAWTEEYTTTIAKNDGSEKKWGMGFNLQMDWYSVKDLFPKPEAPFDVYNAEIKKPLVQYSYDTSANGGKPNPDHPDRNKMLELGNRLSLYWGKELPRIIMAGSEAEARAIYDETLRRMDEMGQKDLDAYSNESFQAAKEALGVKHSWPPLLK